MMTDWDWDRAATAMREAARALKLAEQQVRQKYPSLIVGSSGYVRAVKNRLRRLRKEPASKLNEENKL